MSKLIKATYQLQVYGCGVWLGQEPIEIEALCEQNGDLVKVEFTADSEALIDAFALDREGCEEAAEEAFWESERESCRMASVKQRLGTEAA